MAELSTLGSVIKTAYEGQADTNAFTDADHTKLDGIEASADVTDATNVAAAGAPIITSGAGAPVSTPAAVGDIYIDTTGDIFYVATDTVSSADWDAGVISGGALGTPSSGTATNLTGLPLTTGVTGVLPVANLPASGADATVITGTAGAADELAVFNVDGDIIGEASSPVSLTGNNLLLTTFASGGVVAAHVPYGDASGNLTSAADFTFDGADFTIYNAANDGNPELRLGAADAEELHLQTVFDSAAQTLDYVLFQTDVASATADKGLYRFNVDGTDILDIDDGGVNFAANMGVSIAGTDIITDSAGTATLSNINAIDATTETTLEAALELDSLQGNLGVAHLNGGTGASSATYWRGDGTWVTPSGSGDVSKVGTPVDGQVGVWTGDGTIEGDAALTFDTTDDTLVIAASGKLGFGAVDVLSDSSGTTTLQNIDALDATTKATFEPVCIPIAISDETTALTTGTAKLTYYMPKAFTITAIHACVTTAPTGATLIIDVNDGGTSIMTTNKLVIDVSENDTTTAATAPTLTDTALAAGAAITFDIDQIGSTVAGAGAKVTLIGYWT